MRRSIREGLENVLVFIFARSSYSGLVHGQERHLFRFCPAQLLHQSPTVIFMKSLQLGTHLQDGPFSFWPQKNIFKTCSKRGCGESPSLRTDSVRRFQRYYRGLHHLLRPVFDDEMALGMLSF